MTDEELIERLTAIADDPETAVHNRIRALEVIHRIQRDGRQPGDDAIDKLVKEVLGA
jgi:hypothetical protein